jgi:hypothetical protein
MGNLSLTRVFKTVKPLNLYFPELILEAQHLRGDKPVLGSVDGISGSDDSYGSLTT